MNREISLLLPTCFRVPRVRNCRLIHCINSLSTNVCTSRLSTTLSPFPEFTALGIIAGSQTHILQFQHPKHETDSLTSVHVSIMFLFSSGSPPSHGQGGQGPRPHGLPWWLHPGVFLCIVCSNLLVLSLADKAVVLVPRVELGFHVNLLFSTPYYRFFLFLQLSFSVLSFYFFIFI